MKEVEKSLARRNALEVSHHRFRCRTVLRLVNEFVLEEDSLKIEPFVWVAVFGDFHAFDPITQQPGRQYSIRISGN
jgi:hypothetical protein